MNAERAWGLLARRWRALAYIAASMFFMALLAALPGT